jgi:Zeta toxin
VIWTAERNRQQGALVSAMYHELAAEALCERKAVLAGGLPGASISDVLVEAGVDPAGYLTISVDQILVWMAERAMIPTVAGLSPMEAADLAHPEAQFLAKRLGLRGLGEGKNLLWEVSFAAQHSIESWIAAHRRAGYTIAGVFAEISIEESVRRTEAEHRRGQDQYRRGHGYGGRFIPPEAIRALADTTPEPARAATGTSPIAVSGTHGETPPTADPAGEVNDLIGSYVTGTLSLEALSQRFQTRPWPAVPRVCPPGLEQAAPAIDDPEPYVPGSFDDVVRAYDLGWLTDTDYQVLATAAAHACQRSNSL